MSVLPGNVPVDGSLRLIVIDHLDHYLQRRPPQASLEAWSKWEECERRYIYFEWFTHGIGKKRDGFRSLINDAATAFLMSFEATLQVLGEERFQGRGADLDRWLSQQREYDVRCRGLRAMRNTVAHLRAEELAVQHGNRTFSIFGATDPGETTPWVLPPLEKAKLPRSPKLDVAAGELATWNQLVAQTPLADLMRHGLSRLRAILIAAE